MKIPLLCTLFLSCIGLSLLDGCDGGPPPSEVCFIVEDPGCQFLGTATLTLNVDTIDVAGRKRRWFSKTGQAIPRTIRKISGDEVFYGFWSRNGHRDHTYAEMFEWKHHRKPTPAEEAAITDDDARSWFDEHYTTSNLFGTEHPQNVQVYTETVGRVCHSYTRGNEGNIYTFVELNGFITFNNGTRCELDFGNWDKDVDPGKNPNIRKARVKRPCPYCS